MIRHYSNGAVGEAPETQFNTLSYSSRITHCPIVIDGQTVAHVTCHTIGLPETNFSVPACARYQGRHIEGWMEFVEDSVEFHPLSRYYPVFIDRNPVR